MFPFDAILLIAYLDSISMPINSIFTKFLRKDQRLQPITEQRLLLNQIHNIQFYLLILSSVCHLEVKPLVVPFSVYVVLQNQIVSLNRITTVSIPENAQQITTLKVRIEDNWTVVVLDRARRLGSDLRKTPLTFRLEVDPCNIHEDASKILLFITGLKSAIVQFFIMIFVPKRNITTLFFSLTIELL